VEPFASIASKRGKIVTIGNPKAVFLLQSSSVRLTATGSLGGSLVVCISYVRQCCVEVDIPERTRFFAFRNLPHVVHSLRSHDF
jgi:hypothetical protein